jgi:hypothetical protein
MKQISTIIVLLTALTTLLCCTNEGKRQQTHLNLLSGKWSFNFP